jgi:hypothetical protein
MGASTVVTPDARHRRGRTLIALLTMTAALAAMAYALAPAPALAYQEDPSSCNMVWGFCTAIPGDGGTPAGDEFGGGFEEEEEEEEDGYGTGNTVGGVTNNDGSNSNGATQYDKLIDQPPFDPSIFRHAGNPGDGSWKRLDPAPYVGDQGDRQWEQWVVGRTRETLRVWDSDGRIRDGANCGTWSDPVGCTLLGIQLFQNTDCERVEEWLERNPGDPTLAAKVVDQCNETEEALDEIVEQWFNLRRVKRHEEEIARKHRQHQRHRARKNHRSVGARR